METVISVAATTTLLTERKTETFEKPSQFHTFEKKIVRFIFFPSLFFCSVLISIQEERKRSRNSVTGKF